jgi:hypothetical protein
MCEKCNWQDHLNYINEGIEDGIDNEVFVGIRDWIEENHHITARQKEVTESIFNDYYSEDWSIYPEDSPYEMQM